MYSSVYSGPRDASPPYRLTPESFKYYDTGALQDSAATAPPTRVEAQTQTPEEPPNEVAQILIGLFGEKTDDLMGSRVDLGVTDKAHRESEKEHMDRDLMDSAVANIDMVEHGLSQMAIADQAVSETAPPARFAKILQRGKDIAEEAVFERPPPPPPGERSLLRTSLSPRNLPLEILSGSPQ
jgi:hypothetical protein